MVFDDDQLLKINYPIGNIQTPTESVSSQPQSQQEQIISKTDVLYHLVSQKADDFMRQVEGGASLFPLANRELGQPIFTPNLLPQISIDRYSRLQEVLRPVAENFAKYTGRGSDEERAGIRVLVNRETSPKAGAFGGSTMVGLGLSDEAFNLERVAAITYSYDFMIDEFIKAAPEAARQLLGVMENAYVSRDLETDESGFLKVLRESSGSDEMFKRLCEETLGKSLIGPSRFDLGMDEPQGIDQKADIKIRAGGYNICTWVGAAALDAQGAFADTDRTVFEIMDSPEYSQMNVLGGIITRLADDMGDIERDMQNGIFNVFVGNEGPQMIEAFSRAANLNEIEKSKIDSSSPQSTLDSFMKIFEQKVVDRLKQPNLPQSERKLLVIFLRSAVITYVNRVGDRELAAAA